MKLKLILILVVNLLLMSLVNAQECKFFEKEIKYGARGEGVTKLQKLLAEQKLLQTNIFGTFGPATRNSLKAYQKINKLKITGNLDLATISTLNQKCSTSSVSKDKESTMYNLLLCIWTILENPKDTNLTRYHSR